MASRPTFVRRHLALVIILALLFPMFSGADETRSTPTRIAVSSGDVTLEAWMWRPQGNGPFPAVLVNHGSGRTREQLARLGPYEKMAETIGPVFARHGYVLL